MIRTKGKIVFKNEYLFKQEEISSMRDRILEVTKEYGLPIDLLHCVEISRRLSSAAANIKYRKIRHQDYSWTLGHVKIALAYNNYLEFGFESTMRSLNHELAHWVVVYLYKHTGHSARFKEVCMALGGSMNAHMAGEKYAECATRDYCKKRRTRNRRSKEMPVWKIVDSMNGWDLF